MDPGLRRDDALKDEQPSRRPILKLQTRHIRKVILIVVDDHGVEPQRMSCKKAVDARPLERNPLIAASTRSTTSPHVNTRTKGAETPGGGAFALFGTRAQSAKANAGNQTSPGANL